MERERNKIMRERLNREREWVQQRWKERNNVGKHELKKKRLREGTKNGWNRMETEMNERCGKEKKYKTMKERKKCRSKI